MPAGVRRKFSRSGRHLKGRPPVGIPLGYFVDDLKLVPATVTVWVTVGFSAGVLVDAGSCVGVLCRVS